MGEKAKNLLFLRKNGFNIPDFFVISHKEISRKNLIFIKNKILKKTKNWQEKVILRSSADLEDNKINSFAGIFESVVIKNKKEIIPAIKKIIYLSKNDKVKNYLKLKKINKKVKISIIVQKFIEGDVSGVIFNLKDKYIINSNLGFANSVVQGKECDEYLINKKGYNIFTVHKFKDSLNKQKIFQIIKLAKKINHIFKCPQDIEWTIKGDILYVLQTRPITVFDEKKEILCWDNSNIAESYSGVVLPLTYSFAKRMYSKVYQRVALASGVSKKKVSFYKKIFDELIGHFYGRMYYNIKNWYRMLTLFPRYEKNRINFDRMISIRSKVELEEENRKNINLLFKIKYFLLVFFKYLFFDISLRRFKNKANTLLKEFQEKDLSNLSTEKLLKEFHNFEKIFTSIWNIPIENDFLAMTFHGFLLEQLKKRNIRESEIVDQLSNIKGLFTVQQTIDLIKLARSPKEESIQKYFKKYGGRFVNELKLESKEMTKNSKEFKKLLLAYKSLKAVNPKKKLSKLNLNLREKFFLNKTKKYLKNREDLRILRAKVFSLARKLFLEIGKRMEEENLLNNQRDIFYLYLEEIENKAIFSKNLKNIVKKRKIEYKKYKKIDACSIIYTDQNKNIIFSEECKEESYHNNIVFGRPCSKGIVTSQVTLVKNSKPPYKRNLGIVVTETADPGWAPFLGLCKGIIIEKGGILSHISILARELGIPCIINVPHITKKIKKGDKVYMNGFTGEIKIGRNN